MSNVFHLLQVYIHICEMQYNIFILYNFDINNESLYLGMCFVDYFKENYI